jgi:hypothetical protein
MTDVPRSTAPDGSTIPEADREPECPPAWREQILARLRHIEPEAVEELDALKLDLGIPNVKSHRFTKAHGALVMRLIGEVVGPAVFIVTEEPTPASVHDDAPEAYQPHDW